MTVSECSGPTAVNGGTSLHGDIVPRQKGVDLALFVASDDSSEGRGQVGKRVDCVELDEVDGSLFRRHNLRAVTMIALTGRCHP